MRTSQTPGRWILHIDMDAFYAAIEQRDCPAYRGKPVIVGADPQSGRGRGVVSAASYEARRFGIHSAMPISQAYRRCPHGVFLPVRMDRYQEVSARIFSIFHRYTDLVEPLSLDEAFLDVTGSLQLWGTPQAIGRRIQQDIWEEHRLTASVGVAMSKFIAKIASDLRKPQGFVVVPAGTEQAFLHPLPVERIWGVGPKTAAGLRGRGIHTIGQLAQVPCALVTAWFGRHGRHLWELAHGIDDREVIPEHPTHSLGAEVTFDRDTDDRDVIHQTLLRLAQRVGRRARAEGVKIQTLTLKLRTASFHTITRTCSLQDPVDRDAELHRVAQTLLHRVPLKAGQKVRLLGLAGSNLRNLREEPVQLSLFGSPGPAVDPLAKAVDTLRARFGEEIIQPATLLTSRQRESGLPGSPRWRHGV
ncbi:MAG: DNA polymerase IV [Nitrospirae bacterium]|nr:MAG: DNA polymerase IV [Nitrospirota bacterium]